MDVERLIGQPVSVAIEKRTKESSRSWTLTFSLPDRRFQPGQFLMVWIPGQDEIPMSISHWDRPEVGITVLPVGTATEALISMSEGQLIGVRGPFGKGFKVRRNRALVVGGGIGTAPLRPLIRNLVALDANPTFLIGARNSGDLLFADEFRNVSKPKVRLQLVTDDGSTGFKGLATQAAEELMAKEKFDSLYACGPEPMMVRLYELALRNKVDIQVSLERFMKCGCGICGTCAMDPDGQMVCVDGPVFNKKQLAGLTEFGMYRRDQMGVKKKA